MKQLASLCVQSLLLVSLSAPVLANPVYWTDWTAVPTAASAEGSIQVDNTLVGVTYTGSSNHAFVQTGSGTNYWGGNAYTQGSVDNAPLPSELVALNAGGAVTISFSQPVVDPYIGLVSWNGNTVNFGQPISIDSFGPGFWGTGTPVLNSAQTGFFGNGEVHGVISLKGTYSALSFSHTSENWHGFTVGVSAVPWPASAWLFALGLGVLGTSTSGVGIFAVSSTNVDAHCSPSGT